MWVSAAAVAVLCHWWVCRWHILPPLLLLVLLVSSCLLFIADPFPLSTSTVSAAYRPEQPESRFNVQLICTSRSAPARLISWQQQQQSGSAGKLIIDCSLRCDVFRCVCAASASSAAVIGCWWAEGEDGEEENNCHRHHHHEYILLSDCAGHPSDLPSSSYCHASASFNDCCFWCCFCC